MEKSTHTPEYASLRAELLSARETAGLTQRQLASRLKVPPSWIAKVESGERRVDLVEFAWVILACDRDPVPITKRLLQQISARHAKRTAKGGKSK